MRDMLETEIRLTNRVDNLPDDFDFATQKFRLPEVDMNRLIFGGSEYVKDGLIPMTEWLGRSPWSDRMLGINESVWKHAQVDTPFGKIPSKSHEVNGEQLQILCRLYWMTKDPRYQTWAFRLADYYFQEHLPTEAEYLSLDDHGCEVIGGLAGAYFLAAHTDPERKKKYHMPIHKMLDRILEVGMNENGFVYEAVNPQTGEIKREALSDNWGYDYNAFLNVAQIDNDERYFDAVRNVLANTPKYKDYKWEGGIADGYADAIEGGLNLLNRLPDDGAFEWVDYSTEIMLNIQRYDGIIEGWHGDGNYTRTALMYALWKTQGVYCKPWRADLCLGAVEKDGVVYLAMNADWNWSGKVIFDIPRHKEILNLPFDYPRINQFPEWFTVEADAPYNVKINDGETVNMPGRKLRAGLPLTVEAKKPVFVKVWE